MDKQEAACYLLKFEERIPESVVDAQDKEVGNGNVCGEDHRPIRRAD